jgi:nucleotide-binding universal stress UspA family protein
MYQRILVPIDGSPTSNRGLDEAATLAKLTGGRLRLVHAVDELTYANGFETYAAYAADLVPLMKKAGEDVLQRGKQRAEARGVPVDVLLLESLGVRLGDLVIEHAQSWKADLIVIGTHGRRGVRRLLLGSDAEQILRLSPVPVLLVRGVTVDADRTIATA